MAQSTLTSAELSMTTFLIGTLLTDVDGAKKDIKLKRAGKLFTTKQGKKLFTFIKEAYKVVDKEELKSMAKKLQKQKGEAALTLADCINNYESAFGVRK